MGVIHSVFFPSRRCANSSIFIYNVAFQVSSSNIIKIVLASPLGCWIVWLGKYGQNTSLIGQSVFLSMGF